MCLKKGKRLKNEDNGDEDQNSEDKDDKVQNSKDQNGKDQNSEELNCEDKNKKKKSGSRKIMNVLYYLVLVVLAGIFIFAGYKLYQIKHNYDIAVNEYKELDNTVKITDESENAKENDTQESDASEETQVYYPTVDIDFDTLYEKNSDVIGWLYLPVLDISYPVMQSKDNEHYLHYTYEGTKNSSGSIFMDYQSDAGMKDMNTIIYGHNMKNGSMFGKLKKFNQDTELCDKDPYIYYFSKKSSYKFRIFAYYVTTVGSTTYTNMASETEYDKYMEYVDSVNQYKTEVENPDRGNILTLSTCSGLHSDKRMIVQGILVDRKSAQ